MSGREGLPNEVVETQMREEEWGQSEMWRTDISTKKTCIGEAANAKVLRQSVPEMPKKKHAHWGRQYTALTCSFPSLEPVCCPMSSSNCCFLTCTQVSQEPGQVVCYSHLFQNFQQFIVIHTMEGFGVVNKAEIDVCLELSCFFDDPSDVGNLISGSSAFSETSLNIWKFTVHVLLKPGLENFEHHFTSV